jgi:hypothetical protein
MLAEAEIQEAEPADQEVIARALDEHVDAPVDDLLKEAKELADASRIGGGASR